MFKRDANQTSQPHRGRGSSTASAITLNANNRSSHGPKSIFPRFEEVEIEGDIDWNVQQALVKRGVKLFPVSPNDFNMGSFHATYLPGDDTIHGVADPRRRGQAKGY